MTLDLYFLYELIITREYLINSRHYPEQSPKTGVRIFASFQYFKNTWKFCIVFKHKRFRKNTQQAFTTSFGLSLLHWAFTVQLRALSGATNLPNTWRGMKLCCSTWRLSIDWGIQHLSEKGNLCITPAKRFISSLPLTDSTSKSAGFTFNSMNLFLDSGDVGITIKLFSSKGCLNDFFVREGWF